MTTNDPSNPFVAPTARLEDHIDAHGASHLLADTRVAPAGAAMQWLQTGWTMFLQAPGTWIGIVLLYLLIMVVVSILPVVGILNAVLGPVFAAGIILACEGQHRGTAPTVAHLFEGFKRNTGNLILIGVLYMVGIVLITMVAAGGGLAMMLPLLALGGDEATATPAAIGMVILVALAAFALGLPLALSMWWAPALVAVHDLPSFEAMKRSFSACLRNWRALLVYALLTIVVCIVAVIPLGLGLLVAGPVLAIGWWAGYRDIFVE
jgi:uncharacterized membrane protein